MSLPGYDAWLERPYRKAAEESEAFLWFCEQNELDADDPKSFMAWEEACYDDATERAADEYEAYLERIEDEAQERME